jgi:glutamate synthase domain-containing protein 2/rubredoxin
MMNMRCSLCSFLYDEDVEELAWSSLPDDWVCPVCGSSKEAFVEDSPAKTVAPPPSPTASPARKYQCNLCGHIYDEGKEGIRWEDLPDDWECPLCGSSKSQFSPMETPGKRPAPQKPTSMLEYLSEWRRSKDDVEIHMTSIHQMAETGDSLVEPMRSKEPVISWNDILLCGAQLARLPLNDYVPVNTRVTIGPRAAKPLVLETPVYVTHMSFGALSREAKLALAKGTAKVKTATCSGEGGILPESLQAAYRFIFEYVPNKYSVTDEYLQAVDAIEIKIGQSAKPGMGGHLPESKVTDEIATIRGFPPGRAITSPAGFREIQTPEDVRKMVDMLRKRSGGKPIGIKLAAGHIEEDLSIALAAGVDFITIDGRAGATGSAKKVVKDTASVPTVFALSRARRYLDKHDDGKTSLLITGGLRVSSDFFKALAMGADAIAIGTAAMMALGCQQYRLCDRGKCPVGIATQDPALRTRLNVDLSAERVANFLKATTHELEAFCRMTGHRSITDILTSDLCTTNSEISDYTDVPHA